MKYTGEEGGFFGEEDRRSAGKIIIDNNAAVFQTGAGYNDVSKLSILSANTSSLGVGVENEAGFKSIRDVNLSALGGGNSAIPLLDEAINTVNMERGVIGSHQRNILESQLRNLRVTRENLVAAGSAIEDTDYANEVAKMVRSQILLAGQFSVLSHSNKLKGKVEMLLNNS